MSRCGNCDSLFFKTLEVRLAKVEAGAPVVMLYKKRCKRCKFKYLFRKPVTGGAMTLATHAEWLQGQKLPEGAETRVRILASEYSQRVGRSAEKGGMYLEELRRKRR